MTASPEAVMPLAVTVDTKGRKRQKKKRMTHHLKLHFREKCPDASEVQKLHPAIKGVFVPSRPSTARFCIIKLKSAAALEEVRSALHGKHIEPHKGLLKCYDTTASVLKKLPGFQPELQKNMTKTEIKHSKMASKVTTVDVKLNSTARELYVRYGICLGNQSVPPQSQRYLPEIQADIENSDVSDSEL